MEYGLKRFRARLSRFASRAIRGEFSTLASSPHDGIDRGRTDAVVGWDQRLLLQGMARALLSRETSRQRHAALLRRAFPDRGDQQYVLPHARRDDAGAMVDAG